MRFAAAFVGTLTVLILAAPAKGHWSPGPHNARHAIMWAFCGHQYRRPCWLGRQATVVADCETGGTFSPWASNGQYLGLFQVSGWWRRTVPGWGVDPWSQSRHAYRVWRVASWDDWECAYRMGIL